MKLIIKGLGLSALVLSMFAHADSKTLNVYAWGGYLPEASLKAFENKKALRLIIRPLRIMNQCTPS